MKRFFTLLCAVMVAVSSLSLTGCGDKKGDKPADKKADDKKADDKKADDKKADDKKDAK